MHYIKGKGWFESNGSKVGSARDVSLRLAKVYGFENDRKSFTRLVIESRVAFGLLNEQFQIGRNIADTREAKVAA